MFVKGYLGILGIFGSKSSRGWRYDWARGGGAVAALLRNQLSFVVESPVKKTFLSAIHAYFSRTPF